MVTQGRAFIVSSGTRILVIDRDCAGMMYTYSRTPRENSFWPI